MLVLSPVEDTSSRSCVVFAGGRASTTDPVPLGYFRRHGYTLVAERHAAEVQGEPGDTRPSDSAPKADWVDYALSQPKTDTEAEWAKAKTTTKAALVAYFRGES